MEGLLPLWEASLIERMVNLRCLLLPSCGLTAIPPGKLLPYFLVRSVSSLIPGSFLTTCCGNSIISQEDYCIQSCCHSS